MSRASARQAVRSQYFFVVNDEEAFSVFGRSEVQGVSRIRQVTDVPCLIAMAILLAGMLIMDINARRFGNVLRLSEPIDFLGNLCGYDEVVRDQPLGYFPNPYSEMIVCVAACPKTAADGHYTLPDGPMGKMHTRQAYPTSKIHGQDCLPLDLDLAHSIISTKSVQSEVYRSFGVVFTSPGAMSMVLFVPFLYSFIFVVMLLYVPNAAATLAISSTAVTLSLVAATTDLDEDILKNIPLYPETHPLMLDHNITFRNLAYTGSMICFLFLILAIRGMVRASSVFKECMAAIVDKNVLVTIFASMFISFLRISFIVHVARHSALLMSVVSPVQVEVELLGEWQVVQRMAWSPSFLYGVFFYAFGTYWILEFMSFSNKYITAQVLCHNYFALKARNEQGQELSHGAVNPMFYAVYSLCRYHLGSVALSALLSAPCRTLKFVISFLVPDRPNLQNSLNEQHRMAYYLFFPLIQMDILFLRFFKDSVWVMLPLKGYKYMDAARRSEGLLNRCRGKIPNLTNFTASIEMYMNISVGLTTMFWTFFLFREPRHGKYHEVEELTFKDAMGNLMVAPAHSPLLTLPVMFSFGLWVGNGTLHLVTMASQTLTTCYCIDVEMAGGTETDALYLPVTLKEVYKDLGGGESERELSEMIEQSAMDA